MIKEFLTRKLLERQLRDVPESQRAPIMAMMEKDPELFQKISGEIKAEMKKGKDQMAAAMIVMPKYQSQLAALMGAPQSRQPFNPNGSIRR